MARRDGEIGSALIVALFFAIIVTGVVATGAMYVRSQRAATETQFRVYSQATQFARSGLTETLSWFRRQPSQPVDTFSPEIDALATPPIVDTLDPEIGIVREFRISGSTWGRYEVWKDWAADPDADRLPWREQMRAVDVSAQRGLGSGGAAWRLRSVGYLFQNNDPNLPFDQSPNRVIASRILESEIMRIKIVPPGQAALCAGNGSATNVNLLGRIVGGPTGAGIFYRSGTGAPSTGPWWQMRVTGMPALSVSATYDDSYEAVFGITYDELRGASDAYITAASDFPSPLQRNTIVVAEMGTLQFTAARPLLGTALVVVRGNVVIEAGSNSNFTGFLFVDGNLTIGAPSALTGAVVVRGSFTAEGTGDYATVTFDQEALEALRFAMGQYRMAGAIRPVHNRE